MLTLRTPLLKTLAVAALVAGSASWTHAADVTMRVALSVHFSWAYPRPPASIWTSNSTPWMW